MKDRFIILITCLLIGNMHILKAQLNETDSLALVALYNQTDGSNWSVSWDIENDPVTNWFGVSLNNTGTRVTGINLPNNQLQGSIPDSLFLINHLKTLNLSDNQLSGALSSEISQFDSLITLNLSANSLNDSLPASIGNLTTLTTVNISRNELTGPLPASIGNLSELEILDLSENLITDSIPEDLYNLTTLKELYLNNNNLTGSLSANLTNMGQLIVIDLSSNSISGEIPEDIQALEFLVRLNLSENQLSGNIPVSIGALDSLEVLDLANNFLSDSIPAEIGDLQSLQSLDLSTNQLTGNVPATIGQLDQLEILQINNNFLSGPFESTISQLSQLNVLNLSFNQFSDSIPGTIASLKALNILNLSNNRFYQLPDMTGITSEGANPVVDVSNNELSFGDLEPNITLFTQPQQYAQQAGIGEEITEAIPLGATDTLRLVTEGNNNMYTWIKGADTLLTSTDSIFIFEDFQLSDTGTYYCKVSNSLVPGLVLESEPFNILVAVSQNDRNSLLSLYNQTDGENWSITWDFDLPVSFWYGVTVTNERVTSINLSENGLRGELPEEINALDQLRSLRLNNNELVGSLPDSLFRLTRLEILDLSSNQLIDSISHQFDSLTLLRQLILSNNEFTGHVPESLGLLKELRVIDLSENNLNGEFRLVPDSLIHLREIILSGNRLTGSLPEINTPLPELQRFLINDNRMSGPISAGFEHFENLRFLDLSENDLSDSVPSALGNLSQLIEMRLYGNSLTGAIPETFRDLTSLEVLYLNNNQLEDLPELDLDNILEFRVFNNNLTFEDILPNLLHFTEIGRKEEFLWEPQNNNPFYQTLLLETGGDTALVSPDQTNGNIYLWTKDGVNTGVDSAAFVLDSVLFSSNGVYNCRVSNRIVDSLGFDQIFFSFIYQVEVYPADPQVALPEPYCIGSSRIVLETETIVPGLNTTWFIKNEAREDSIIGQGGILSYELTRSLDTIYVFNRVGNLNSDTLLIPVFLKPVIYERNDSLHLQGYIEGFDYLWYQEDIQIADNITSILPPGSDTYYVQSIHDQCAATSDPYIFNADTSGIITDLIIQEPFNNEINIYPNPASELITVKIHESIRDEIRIRLYDLNGKVIGHQILKPEFIPQDISIPVHHLKRGMYLLKVVYGNTQDIRRILVE